MLSQNSSSLPTSLSPRPLKQRLPVSPKAKTPLYSTTKNIAPITLKHLETHHKNASEHFVMLQKKPLKSMPKISLKEIPPPSQSNFASLSYFRKLSEI